jgi:hypothetical protein
VSKRFAWVALIRWLSWSAAAVLTSYLPWRGLCREVKGRTLARWVAADRTIRKHLGVNGRGR